MANGNGTVARSKKKPGKVWPWVVGAVVPMIVGAAWFFWPSKADAKEKEKDAAPLKPSDADQIPTLICAAWRAGDRGAAAIAATVAARLRPGIMFPGDSESGPTTRAIWIEVLGAVETILGNAAAAGVDVCEFLEGKPQPEPEPDPSPLGQLPDPAKMRALLSSINYDVPIGNMPLNVPSIVTEGGQPGPGAVWLPNGFVNQFQSDWNAVVSATKSGKIPKGPLEWATWPPELGKTGTDGVGGNKTLRRLEASAANQFAGHAWQALVSQARA